MKRREFLVNAARGLGSAWLASKLLTDRDVFAAELPPLNQKFNAHDTVTLGATGIVTSRLAMGTGTHGGGSRSDQTVLGMTELTALLLNGYDNGLRFFDTADSYGSHPYVASALKQLPRDKVVVMTKTDNRDANGVKADLERFRRELGTDYIDICLVHCVTEADWSTRYRGVMDVLSEAKEKGVIRTHGVSCHSIEALKTAAATPWVEVDLVRMNPVGAYMDADPETVAGVIKEMRAAGKGIIGMKILGQGKLRHRQSEAIHYALGLGLLDAFTIGAASKSEQMDLIGRIAAAA
ncbi:MAG TPA: aldo/keto reductase [Terracidiphilus sp.]|jgi:aryl-alcohol dehydrogenase-like predicted oxidoreductase